MAREDVRKEAGRDDLVARAAIALVQAPVDSVAASRLANARHAVRHPQLEHVLRRRPLLFAAGVTMHVDEARQHPDSGAVDLLHRIFRPSFGLDRHLRVADAAHLADAVSFDDDVDRPDRRRARAIDERHAADDEARERPFPFAGLAIGGIRRRGGEGSGSDSKEDEDQRLAHFRILPDATRGRREINVECSMLNVQC